MITLEPFKPNLLLQNAHVQTIAGALFRHERGVTFRRTRLDTPDGDFIDVDFADVTELEWDVLGDDAPVVLVLHGLEGSAEAGYMFETYRQLARRGIRAVGLNFRSCSGAMNRTNRFYHAGASDDVILVHNWLLSLYPDVAHGIMGFSLGANLTLKYLGENNARRSAIPQIKAAAAISPFFDMNQSSDVFEHGSGRFYARRFLGELQAKLRIKAAQLRGVIDVEAALRATTVREFDRLVTAPLGGFLDAQDYYAQVSSINFVADVKVPTLVLRALDDPFFANDLPMELLRQNPCLQLGFTEYGGHVGFVEGFGRNFWAERQAACFLATQLYDR